MKRSFEGYDDSHNKRHKSNRYDRRGDGDRRRINDPISMKNKLQAKITKTGDDRSFLHYKLVADALTNELPEEQDTIINLIYRWYVFFWLK